MSASGDIAGLDRDRLREMFDLRSAMNKASGADYTGDPYPIWHQLRESGPVHPGTVHGLTGYPGDAIFHGLGDPDRQSFSAFSYEAVDFAYRNDHLFASSPQAVDQGVDSVGMEASMLMMGGDRHRRYRSLVQPSFVPAKMQWWIDTWIHETVNALIDNIAGQGHAELNVDFCAAIPVLTITGSFGVPVDQALEIRHAATEPLKVVEALAPIIADRRENPRDDLISVLVQAELTDETGTHHLSDAEIFSFGVLLLAAGSGTTWKQMGITLVALLQRPHLLEAIRADRTLLRGAIEESLRWQATDPMFSRWVTEDTELFGQRLPKGSVLHLCLGAANRDPARWDDPDVFDITRRPKPSFGFGGGPHVCIGQHVARAEMTHGIGALLDRLPNLRLDPDKAEPSYIGLYERGATEIPVLFDRS